MKKAFTLIELLIVVAIIAILAAIAVPNFLEAQTRAKVSRVLADQRSYATALETYYIDNNSYPIHWPWTDPPIGGKPTTGMNNLNYNAQLASDANITGDTLTDLTNIPTFGLPTAGNNTALGLTTPVSYISTLSPDTFGLYKQATFAYASGPAGFLLWSPGPDGTDSLDGASATGDSNNGNNAEYILAGGQSLPSPYLITGPDTDAPEPTGAPTTGASYTYDATNGTASAGDVYRTK